VIAVGDTATSTAIATLIATFITAGAAWATQKSAAKAAVMNQSTASRTDIEKEAFSRAEAFYKGAMDRQDAEIARQDKEINECHAENRALKVEVDGLKTRVKTLEDELETARRALRLRYPDE